MLTGADKQFVLELWAEERKRPGFDFEEFCAKTSEGLQVSDASVRRAIKNHQSLFEVNIRTASRTKAQEIAEAMGADVYAAMEALRNGLSAYKERLVVDKETGIPVKDPETGEHVFVRSPDHQVRVRAAAEIIKIWGGYAPKQVEVSGEVHHQHMLQNRTKEELQAELAKTLAEIQRSGYVLDVKPEPAAGESNMLESCGE